MSDSDGLFVLVLGGLGWVALVTWVVVRRIRLRRRVAAAGPRGARVLLHAHRHSAAGGLVPVVEDLLDRVERLEADVANLTPSDPPGEG